MLKRFFAALSPFLFVLSISGTLFAVPVQARVNVPLDGICFGGSEGEECGPAGTEVNAKCIDEGDRLRCRMLVCAEGEDADECEPLVTAPVVKRNPIKGPALSVAIPTVSLSALGFGDSESGKNAAFIPWIAEYVSGVYIYAVGLAAVVAAVMVMVGGIQYLIAGGNAGTVSAAKTRMLNAIAGLLMVVGAHLILTTINPDLTVFDELRVQTVERQPFTVVPDGQLALAGISKEEKAAMLKKVRARANEMGGNEFECFVYGSMVFESGGRSNAIGHDENSRRTDAMISSRRNFINSGVKYSGATFTPLNCNSNSCQNEGPDNDDHVNLLDPPDYGLDWRFSHGLGAGQSTIAPNMRPCSGRENEGRGFRTGTKCYTLPDLLDPDKQIEAMLEHYRVCWTRAGQDPGTAYACYGGRRNADGSFNPENEASQLRVEQFDKCMAAF